ncbi:23815_t:CDS:2, partial [Racocetra persica]
IYFANPYDLYIDTDYQIEDLINLSEELKPLKTSYISNNNLQLTQYSDPTNITYLEDSSFSKGSISYQLPISTSLPESVVLNPNFSTPYESFASGSTSKVENMIQDLTDSLKKMRLNLVQQDNKKEAYTVKSGYNLNNRNQDRNRKISPNIQIPEEDPDQDLEIIEEIYLEVKKGIEEILEIIIVMTEADLEIIITMIETDNKETTSTNHWDTLLNNTSIRGALANYLQETEFQKEELNFQEVYTIGQLELEEEYLLTSENHVET